MNIHLSENNYLLLKNFINSEQAKLLSKEFLDFCQINDVGGDDQVPRSASHYDFLPFVKLLVDKTSELSSAAEISLLPTYCYARVYHRGSDLKPHIDRPSCELSITLNLDHDEAWPIFIKTPNGKDVKVILQPGDAMMYRGCVAEHWREEFTGEKCVQLFMHYVDINGPNKDHYFDKKNLNDLRTNAGYDQPIPDVDQPHVFKFHDVLVDDKAEPIEIDLSEMPRHLTDYIRIIENIIPDSVCNEIIGEFCDNNEWKKAMVGSGTVAPKIRNVNVVTIDDPGIMGKNLSVRNKLIAELDEAMFFAIQRYHQKIPSMHKTLSGYNGRSGYDLLQYNPGDFYREHTDFGSGQHRVLSLSFCLNDDYEGGEFGFFSGTHKIKPPKGSILIFPSNFMYPHEIFPVLKGNRYSIITWLIDTL